MPPRRNLAALAGLALSLAAARAATAQPDLALSNECHVARARGDLVAAEAACRAALASDVSVDNLLGLALVLGERPGDEAYAEAEQLIHRALDLTPRAPSVFVARFTVAARHGDVYRMHDALTALRRVGLEPSYLAPYELGLARALAQRGHADGEAYRGARGWAKAALDHAPGERGILDGAAEVADTLGDASLLGVVAERLRALAPDDPHALYLTARQRMAEHDWQGARAALARARERGFDVARCDALGRKIEEGEPWLDRVLTALALTAAVWLGTGAALFAASFVLSALTLRAVRALASDPAHAEPSVAVGLRKAYAALIVCTSVFIYGSLPLVALAVLAAGAAVVVAFVVGARVSIFLLWSFVSAVLGVAWAALVSLRAQWGADEPGLEVELAEEPQLRALLHEVAAKLGTRAIERVYVTPGSELAVFERGQPLGLLPGEGERCLVVGLALLDGLRVGDFKALLAHEYGHFARRDTAGGGLALQVIASLVSFIVQLAQRGLAVWYNPAWQLVRVLLRLFVRATQGASRLQEVLADRAAVLAYGSAPFARGLQHAVAGAVVFDDQLDTLVRGRAGRSQPFGNFYREVRAVAPGALVHEGVAEALDAEASAYDSHPVPSARLAFAQALAVVEQGAAEDEADAGSLLARRSELEAQITNHVNARLGLMAPAEAVS